MNNEEVSFLAFMEALYCNREIEMTLQGNAYFLSSCMDECEENEYAILNVKERKVIFCGTVDEIIMFEFDEHKTLKTNFSDFNIEYIF